MRVWQLPVRLEEVRQCGHRKHGNALTFSVKKEYCILSREHYLKRVSFSLSSSASSPPPTPLPSLLDATYLMGGSGERPRLLGWCIRWWDNVQFLTERQLGHCIFLFLLFWLELLILREGWGHLELILQGMSRMCMAVCWFQLSLFRLLHLIKGSLSLSSCYFQHRTDSLGHFLKLWIKTGYCNQNVNNFIT